jgi:ribosome recycling factor
MPPRELADAIDDDVGGVRGVLLCAASHAEVHDVPRGVVSDRDPTSQPVAPIQRSDERHIPAKQCFLHRQTSSKILQRIERRGVSAPICGRCEKNQKSVLSTHSAFRRNVMLDEVFEDLRSNNDKTLQSLQADLAKIRTGRASLGMLDGVRVEYYGQATPLSQVATMRVADPRLITIQPWERALIGEIEKAISSSDLGLNPSNDGTLIRVPIPALSGERRQELVKVARRAGEDRKIALRAHRRDANDLVKELEKESDITQDEEHRAYDKINAITDQYVAKVDDMLTSKEADILEV